MSDRHPVPGDEIPPELADQLRAEFGDPADDRGAVGAGAVGDWSSIERRAQGQSQRRRAALVGAAATVVLLGVAVALVVSSRNSGRTSLATADSRPSSPTADPAIGTPPIPHGSGPTTSTSAVLLPVITYPGLGPVATFPTKGPATTEPASPITTPTTGAPGTTTAGGPVDCGTAYLASGWPTTTAGSPAASACILDAFAAGTPATYVVRAQTDGNGGHIQITTYVVVGVQRVQRTVDDRGAQPAGGVTTTTCTGLAFSMATAVTASGCT